MEIFKIVVLGLSGLLLTVVGLMRVFNPIKSLCLKVYAENPEKTLEGKADVFNEMRGAGGVTFSAGVVILLGTVLPAMRLTSFVVAVLFFLGFALGRLFSFASDGKPNKDLVQGTVTELVLSTANIVCLVGILLQN